MVQSALFLGKAWHVPSAVVGALVLAVLTGLPNVYAVPAVVFGLGRGSRASVTETVWLLGLTLVSLFLLLRGALSRWGGAIVIALYLILVAVRL